MSNEHERNQPLILVDGSSYFFRAFHALPPLMNSKKQPTGAIYGVANMIRRLLKDYPSPRIAVVFDAKGKTFRDAWYPDYKAHRPPMPTELSSQFIPLTDLLRAMGLPLLIIEGVEADDVIGTLAIQAEQANIPVIISTGDKDMAQLVNSHVTLINTMSNQRLDSSGVKEKFGVMPKQIIDYLTLMGDTVDNIPGVKQCGPKTALKWLNEYHSLDNLMNHANDIGGKIGESLRASLSHLPLSKKLVTIKTDVNLPVTLDSLHAQSEDRETLIQLTRELEFKSWLKDLLAIQQPEHPNIHEKMITPKINYTLINTWPALEAWLRQLNQCTLFCIDTETTSLDTLEAEIVGIAIAIEENNPIYIPLAHCDDTKQLPRTQVLEALKPILENKQIGKLGQNLKYDYNVFKNYDITLQGIAFDSMLESYVLNSSANRHDMDSLALSYLDYQIIRFEDVAGKGAKQIRFDHVPVSIAAPYSAEDADITLKLHHTLYALLNDQLKSVLHDIEMPLLTVLADM